jgi:hypothetical protein
VDPLGTDKTRLDSGVELHLHGLMRLASPLMELSIRKEDSRDTARLELILESANTATNGAHQ